MTKKYGRFRTTTRNGKATHTGTSGGRTIEISDADFKRLGRNVSGKAKVTDLRTGEALTAKVVTLRLL
jgi:hypothetical protein